MRSVCLGLIPTFLGVVYASSISSDPHDRVYRLHVPETVAAPAAETEADVIVYGATPGGCAAAIAAGREGRSVVLLEPSLYIGAMMSGGLGLADYGMHSSRVIGGLSQEFFERIAVKYNQTFKFPPDNQCGAHSVPWVSEPHVAETVFREMLEGANVSIQLNTRVLRAQVTTATSSDPRIAAVVTADGGMLTAKVFIDGTYEGALMKMSGVSYTFGREANTTYNESTAGRLPPPEVNWPYGDRSAQLPHGINPYTDESNSTLIPGVWGGKVAAPGAADDRVGSYDWRVVLTDNPDNMVPLPKPENYDPTEFELIRRAMKAGWYPSVAGMNVPNRKTDWKMFATFGEHPNAQWNYPNGTYEEQQAVVAEFKRYGIALLHFFQVDDSVPALTREKLSKLGLCKDEFNRSADGDHWMSQLYIRTALRMVGSDIMTQRDVVPSAWVPRSDAIGVASYTVDIPGPVQTIVHNGAVLNEGALKVPYFCDPSRAPFALPYGVMVPRSGEVQNLLVPVAISASHVAFNAVRMEPTWMILGHAAGTAASIVAAGGTAPAGGVRSIDVTHLRARLLATGQVLEPRAPPAPTQPPPTPPTPPTPPPLRGDEWYAWIPMWNSTIRGGIHVLVATEDGSLLKRQLASSHSLPPADVQIFQKGDHVNLTSAQIPAPADGKYWLVHVTNTGLW